jgi:hypothetical protein
MALTTEQANALDKYHGGWTCRASFWLPDGTGPVWCTNSQDHEGPHVAGTNTETPPLLIWDDDGTILYDSIGGGSR